MTGPAAAAQHRKQPARHRKANHVPAKRPLAKTAAARKITNQEIARQFAEIADLLDLQDANPFRVRAYRNAARMIQRYGVAMYELVAGGHDLTELPGIGEDLAGKITEAVGRGKPLILDQLRRKTPAHLAELLDVPRVGPKRALQLWHGLHIRSREQLYQAARDGRLAKVKGLGAAFERALRDSGIGQANTRTGRIPISVAMPMAEALSAQLRKAVGALRVEICGSLRRGRDSIGDIDLLVAAPQGKPVIEAFTRLEAVSEVFAAGETRATVILKSGTQADLRVVEASSFGSALQYLTGSKEHSIALRQLAKARGLKLNEYGVYHGLNRIAGQTEDGVYAALGLPCIPPELRENRGEIETALRGKLPALVEPSDIRGDLHVRVDINAIDAGLQGAARKLGYTYLGLVVRSGDVAKALQTDRRAALRTIDRLGASLDRIGIFRSVECGITSDGRLDLPDEILQRFDAVTAVTSGGTGLSRKQQTERQVRAMKNPLLTFLSQPGRTTSAPSWPYEVDLAKLVAAARAEGTILEITADPALTDVSDSLCRQAKDAGVQLSLSASARSVEDLPKLRFSVLQARRGWIEAANVMNTRPYHDVKALLNRRRSRA